MAWEVSISAVNDHIVVAALSLVRIILKLSLQPTLIDHVPMQLDFDQDHHDVTWPSRGIWVKDLEVNDVGSS